MRACHHFYDPTIMALAERGDRILGALLEKEMSFNQMKFGMMKDMFSIIFPEVSTITRDFVTRLTPEELKRAYIRQAVKCHPHTTENSNKQEQQTRQMQYQRLSMAYKTLLPRVESIHQKVQQIESRHKLSAANKKILAVGGAKGGVGKSMLAANLAVGLALLGQRVVLADLDFGGADAHLHLGVSALDTNWNDFLEKKAQTIDEILFPTRFEGLDLIAGDSSKLGSANLNYFQKLKIIRHLKALHRDYVILDLGGDTSFNVLVFFLMADQRFVVTAAEPASFLDTYNFVKVSFYRFLDRFFAEYELLKDLRERVSIMSTKKPQAPTFQSILKEVRSRHPSATYPLEPAHPPGPSLLVLFRPQEVDPVVPQHVLHHIRGKLPMEPDHVRSVLGVVPSMLKIPPVQDQRHHGGVRLIRLGAPSRVAMGDLAIC